MLRVHIQLTSSRRVLPVELGWILIGNTTRGLEAPDGTAAYAWSYYPNGQPGTLPTEMGEVRDHIRADGWERLVAGIVSELADRRAAREQTDE